MSFLFVLNVYWSILGKILIQRKKNNKEKFIISGEKRENNETDFETLKMELTNLKVTVLQKVNTILKVSYIV